MKKGKNRCSQSATDDDLDELIRELTEEALAMGGGVMFFGPDGVEAMAGPGERSRPAPRCPDPDWWPPST